MKYTRKVSFFQDGGTFSSAFQKARKDKLKEFTWKGRKYTTQTAEEAKAATKPKPAPKKKEEKKKAEKKKVETPPQRVVNPMPDQGSFRQDPRSDFRIKVDNKIDDFLYKVGWKSDGSSDGRGRVRAGVEDMVVPAVAGATLSQLPLVAGTIGAANIPGSFNQATASYQDEHATTGEKIRNTFPLVVNTAAAGFGAYNLPRSVGRINTAVRNSPQYTTQGVRIHDPHAGVTQSTKVRAGRGNNVKTQKIGKGEGHQGFAKHNTGKGQTNATRGGQSGVYQQASHVRGNAVQANRVNANPANPGGLKWGELWTTPPMPYQQYEQSPVQQRPAPAPAPVPAPTQNLQEVIMDVPYYGSPEFQQAYQQAEAQGLESFMFGNKPYIVKQGNPARQVRTVTPGNTPTTILTQPDQEFQQYPDSVSYGPAQGINRVSPLNYGVTGNPRVETTTANKIREIINR